MTNKRIEPAWPESDVPLALLIGLDGDEQVLPLTKYPPPHDILLPRRHQIAVHVSRGLEEPMMNDHRRFVLQPHLQDLSHRWWLVYNEGRTRTPMGGLVYFEEKK